MIQQSYTLPGGQTLPNRLCKAAMTERLSGPDYLPNNLHHLLYRLWVASGAGLHISGNIMVDHRHMESAGNIVVTDQSAIESLLSWTKIVTETGSQFWAQINHPGRQTSLMVSFKPVSASSVWLRRGGFFLPPRTLSAREIDHIIRQFVKTAQICLEGGFTGIQVHAAHGYLISQFLSPLTNQRSDEWGGSLENRARLLLCIAKRIHDIIPPGKALSVKLNSADFQKGGFSENESLEVIDMLTPYLDLIEISGGTYEQQAMMGEHIRDSTQEREAYFLRFARRVRKHSKVPVMVTGGFRSRKGIDSALLGGDVDVVGIARPFCTQPHAISGLLNGNILELTDYFIQNASPWFRFSAEGGYYAKQIVRLAKGQEPNLKLTGNAASKFLIWHEFKKAVSKRRTRFRMKTAVDGT